MEQSNQSKRVLLSVIGVAILVVAVVGVSFAFFNYTRTGAQNTIATGSIYFISTQSEPISITNMFPATREEAQANSRRSSSMTVNISGGTTYTGGIDYTLTAVNINRAAQVANIPVKVVSSSSDAGINYSPASSGAELLIPDNSPTLELGTGHIAAQTNGGQLDSGNRVVTTGTITITAYIPDNVAITDTYNNGAAPTNELGTTADWVNNRTVVNTTEWNLLAETPITFNVKVEANEGTATTWGS